MEGGNIEGGEERVIGRDPRGDTIPVKQNSPITGPKKYPKSSPCNIIMEDL